MHSLTVNRKLLLTALGRVLTVTPTRTTKDVLKLARFSLSGASLHISASDSEVEIVTAVDAEGSGDDTLIDPRLLQSVLAQASDDTVTIRIGESSASVLCSGRSTLPIGDASEISVSPKFEADDFVTVDAKAFEEAFPACADCIDSPDSRPQLLGVAIDIANGALVATDSRRMLVARLTMKKTGTPTAMGSLPVCPPKAGKAIAACSGGEVDIAAENENTLSFRRGDSVVRTRLMQGRFPDWQRVIPAEHKSTTGVVAGAFNSLIRRASLFTSEESFGVDLVFSASDVHASAKSGRGGDCNYSMPIAMDGPPVTVRVNPKYAGDFLSRLDAADSVTVRLISSDAAIVLLCGGWTYLLMPLARN